MRRPTATTACALTLLALLVGLGTPADAQFFRARSACQPGSACSRQAQPAYSGYGYSSYSYQAYYATAPAPQAYYQQPQPAYAQPQGYPQAPSKQMPTAQYGGDPYGFTQWLNGYRAANGRGPVGYDSGLSSEAAANNAHGFGHHYMGSARRQNAGMGAGATVWQMWTQSPAHNSALLDPSITAIGIASTGSVWTFNGR